QTRGEGQGAPGLVGPVEGDEHGGRLGHGDHVPGVWGGWSGMSVYRRVRHPVRVRLVRSLRYMHTSASLVAGLLAVALVGCAGTAPAPAPAPTATTAATVATAESSPATSTGTSSGTSTSIAPTPEDIARERVPQEQRAKAASLMVVGVDNYDDALWKLQQGVGGIRSEEHTSE